MSPSNNSLIDPMEFHKSITSELDVTKDRVRNLIGNAHWGEEGRYKETILRSVLRKFLPKNIDVGTGFVLKREDKETKISDQIDIIIYDNRYPVLFEEGDFIVTTPANVRGIIEVKTSLDTRKLGNSIIQSTKNGNLINKDIFNGIFAYEGRDPYSIRDTQYTRCTIESFENALKESRGAVNHISLGKDIFIKFWDRKSINLNNSEDSNLPRIKYSIYEIEGLSFSYFISNLLEQLSDDQMEERWWFLYPIEGTKERFNTKNIFINSN